MEIKITEADRSRVAKSEQVFEVMLAEFELLDGSMNAKPNIDGSLIPVRAIQMAQRSVCQRDELISCVILGIVEESNTMLPVAIEESNQAGIESALGGILADACLICSHLHFDFWTIANEFSSDSLSQPDSDALIALYKTVGVLASVAMHAETDENSSPDALIQIKQRFGYALTKLCSAVHWLAFNNDMDIVSLLRQTYEIVAATSPFELKN